MYIFALFEDNLTSAYLKLLTRQMPDKQVYLKAKAIASSSIFFLHSKQTQMAPI